MSTSAEDNRIKVYCTVSGLTEKAICELLHSDVTGALDEVIELFCIIFLPNHRPLQIFQYQEETYKKPDYDEQSYFLIVDSANPAADEVLLCNLKGDHGFPDAVREMPAMAGKSAASLGIANSNWVEMRENAWNDEEPRIGRLAIYDNRAADGAGFLRIAEAIDYGLHYLYTDPDELEDSDEPPPIKTTLDDLFRYTAIDLDTPQSLQDLCEYHGHIAKDKDMHSNIFAAIDDDFTDEGILLVQLQPRKELRCQLPLAGELLWWYAVGLMRWEEMVDFASKYSDLDYKWTVDRMMGLETLTHAGQEKKASGAGGDVEDDNKSQGSKEKEDSEEREERRFRYYRSKAGIVIASIDPYEIPSTFTRQRQESDGVDGNGEMGQVEDTLVEELPWDFYLKTDGVEGTT
ncbi:hypothetical protein NLG97_g7155 [Lecanicillium saksenae]|uniref:Uncharacterized protein n=1 Tax=Lecanicillium saksenae TaxID=468837 RepID=A0ACC1QMR2_9HYPO|nr:hypothetical protein NLG97_g7155 [Lecanicillium saksenae]